MLSEVLKVLSSLVRSKWRDHLEDRNATTYVVGVHVPLFATWSSELAPLLIPSPGAVAALVPLPRGLSGDTKLCGHLGPADSEVNGAVNECIKCGLRIVPCRLTALERRQHLRH